MVASTPIYYIHYQKMPLHFLQPNCPGASSTPKKLAIIGTFIDAPAFGEIRVRSDTVVVVDVLSGTIESITPAQAQGSEWECDDSDIKIIDLRANAMRVVLPGFVDCVVTPFSPSHTEWLY